jgi:hypothetical protein
VLSHGAVKRDEQPVCLVIVPMKIRANLPRTAWRRRGPHAGSVTRAGRDAANEAIDRLG